MTQRHIALSFFVTAAVARTMERDERDIISRQITDVGVNY